MSLKGYKLPPAIAPPISRLMAVGPSCRNRSRATGAGSIIPHTRSLKLEDQPMETIGRVSLTDIVAKGLANEQLVLRTEFGSDLYSNHHIHRDHAS